MNCPRSFPGEWLARLRSLGGVAVGDVEGVEGLCGVGVEDVEDIEWV